MRKRMTLKEVLAVWRDQRVSAEDLGEHLSPAELYTLLIQPSHNRKRDEILDHLTRCPRCLQECKEIAESIEEAAVWDVALPKAAATEMAWPKKMPAEGGKYLIEIRRYLGKENKGVITVKVEERYKAALEGKSIVVTDGRGRLLLKGPISDGEVSQVIEGLESIAPQFLVQPE